MAESLVIHEKSGNVRQCASAESLLVMALLKAAGGDVDRGNIKNIETMSCVFIRFLIQGFVLSYPRQSAGT